MDNKNSNIRSERENELHEIGKRHFDTSYLKEIAELQKEGKSIPSSPYYEEPLNEKFKDKIEGWITDAPDSVVFICKILKKIIDIVGFAFMIIGGLAAIFSLWTLYKSFKTVGWSCLVSSQALYIVFYIVLMFIIDKIGLLLYRIVEGE